jgi:hypothetical protein
MDKFEWRASNRDGLLEYGRGYQRAHERGFWLGFMVGVALAIFFCVVVTAR